MSYIRTDKNQFIGELVLSRPSKLNVMDDTFFTGKLIFTN